MLSEETRKDLEKQIEEIKEQQRIERRKLRKKLRKLYSKFLEDMYNQYGDNHQELKYYQLVYGKHLVVTLQTGYHQDIKQLLHYRTTKGKLPKRLETKFNEWLLTNKV